MFIGMFSTNEYLRKGRGTRLPQIILRQPCSLLYEVNAFQ